MSADGAGHEDAHGMQVGNVDIAKAGKQVLSRSMLQGLQTAVRERLSQYVTDDIETDRAAWAQVQADAAR